MKTLVSRIEAVPYGTPKHLVDDMKLKNKTKMNIELLTQHHS